MGKNQIFTKDGQGNTILIFEEDVIDPPKTARWRAMIEALENNADINNKLFLQGSGPGYARLLFLLTRGESGNGSDAVLQTELQKLLSDKHPVSQRRLIFHNSGVGTGNWTTDERNQMNTYFTNHDFNIQIVA